MPKSFWIHLKLYILITFSDNFNLCYSLFSKVYCWLIIQLWLHQTFRKKTYILLAVFHKKWVHAKQRRQIKIIHGLLLQMPKTIFYQTLSTKADFQFKESTGVPQMTRILLLGKKTALQPTKRRYINNFMMVEEFLLLLLLPIY